MCRYLASKLDLDVNLSTLSHFEMYSKNLEKSSSLEFLPFVLPGPWKRDPGVPGDHVVVDRQDGLRVHPHPSHLGKQLYQDQWSGTKIKDQVLRSSKKSLEVTCQCINIFSVLILAYPNNSAREKDRSFLRGSLLESTGFVEVHREGVPQGDQLQMDQGKTTTVHSRCNFGKLNYESWKWGTLLNHDW